MVKVGIIGLGNMGSVHLKLLQEQVENAQVVAVCDGDEKRLKGLDSGIAAFTSPGEFFDHGSMDAVLIATPHYSHTTLGVEALSRGLHVLVEKPIGVHKADCQRLIDARRGADQVFAAVFNQRTDPVYQWIKTQVSSGELGELQRVSWIITDWFRSERYYQSGGWRATWAGEGGGVLLNQCPHNLDLFQWICGMPVSVQAHCHLGKYHDIEVEDEVTAYLEFGNGATGVFITSTGEAPGTNRLEITGDKGRLVCEDGRVEVIRNQTPTAQFCRETDSIFGKPETVCESFLSEDRGAQHLGILRNFVDAIEEGAELIAPGEEGIRSVELANAMLYSSLKKERVDLPLDGAVFQQELDRLCANSSRKKKVVSSEIASLDNSF